MIQIFVLKRFDVKFKGLVAQGIQHTVPQDAAWLEKV